MWVSTPSICLSLQVLFCTALLSLYVANTVASPFEATCVLHPTEKGSKYGISGTVHFSFDPKDTLVVVTANIHGNEVFGQNSKYAMHVHQYGDLSDSVAGLSAGAHFMSDGSAQSHGCPPSDNRHTGDMGNWTVTNNAITETKELDLIELTAAPSVVGRSVVLHEKVDECNGTTGNSGDRIAFCVIGITNVDYNYAISGALDGKSAEAICVFQPTNHCTGTCTGTAYISGSQNLQFKVHVKGLSGIHGLHIHHYGDLTGMDGSMTGNDYDPFGRNHNLPGTERHLGDLGNLQSYDSVTKDGWYLYNMSTYDDLDDIMGRAMVIYSGQDNGNGEDCNWEGSSGNIIMQCVLGFKNPTTVAPEVPSTVQINNNWQSKSCKGTQPKNSDDNHSGLVAAVVIGWLFFAILLGAILIVFGYRYLSQRRGNRYLYDESANNF